MSKHSDSSNLAEILRELGVRTVGEGSGPHVRGFPVSLKLSSGSALVLDLDDPGCLSALNPDLVGAAVVESDGFPVRSWGVASKSPFLERGSNVLGTELGSLMAAALDGDSGSLLIDGFRYFVSPIELAGRRRVIVLVTQASDERAARRQASKSARSALALKRIGKALTMDQRVQQMSLAAVHEIASVAELASVLLWTLDHEHHVLQLAASIGVNRQGITLLTQIQAEGGSSCLAELVASSRQPFILPRASDHILTADLEAKFCYLKPAGVSVHPLVISDKLLGVIEFIGREGDPNFEENLDLLGTIAEHLALALNSAFLFESFEKMATHDALTGIANHRTMQDFLHRRFAEAQRTGQELGLLMIDVDHFRSFNEEEGHDAGDLVLKLVADALKAAIRPYDLAARYGGEEFTIVMPGSSRASAMAVAERIRKSVATIPFTTSTGGEKHVTVSIGCACYPHNARESGTLLKAADLALYEAKRGGRNKVVGYKGILSGQKQSDDLDLSKLWDLVPRKDRPRSKELMSAIEPHAELLVESLGLSPAQQQNLRGMAMILPTFRRLREADQSPAMQALNESQEFVQIKASLESIDCRYEDCAGKDGLPKAPLLARAMAVLLAIVEERGSPLMGDPGRFDPEIVSILSELDDAA